jgi:hypothetical protein
MQLFCYGLRSIINDDFAAINTTPVQNSKSEIALLFSETRKLLRDGAERASAYLLYFFQDTFHDLFSLHSFRSLFSPDRYFNGVSVSCLFLCTEMQY